MATYEAEGGGVFGESWWTSDWMNEWMVERTREREGEREREMLNQLAVRSLPGKWLFDLARKLRAADAGPTHLRINKGRKEAIVRSTAGRWLIVGEALCRGKGIPCRQQTISPPRERQHRCVSWSLYLPGRGAALHLLLIRVTSKWYFLLIRNNRRLTNGIQIITRDYPSRRDTERERPHLQCYSRVYERWRWGRSNLQCYGRV